MKRLVAIVFVVIVILFARAQFTSALVAPASGTWMTAPGALSQARSGAASVRLYDGRVLVIGGYGDGSAGAVASNAVDAFSTTGTSVPVAPMKMARAHHTATLLYDGTVLVTGGDTAAGTPTATAELYNPFTDTWSFVAPMAEVRSRHTATFLEDGRVLVAGGASVEMYEPWYGTFSFGAVLTPARSGHAAALLKDGRVLIAGGASADGPLDVVDAFQDGVGITAIGTLATPRTALSATTLLDGRVLFAGGRSASGDVPTLETFDPTTGSITLESATLQTPRSGHSAFLLPDNNTVAIVGGTSADVPQSSAELFVPWTGQVRATGAMLHARSDASGAALDPPGALVVAGGWDGQAYESGAEVYGFATVRTDQSDYAPGETVTITGDGWQPGETVTLVLREVPAIDPDLTLTAVADESGHIVSTDFSTDIYDLGVQFNLTATGATSQAEVTFTDGNATITGYVRSSATGNPIAGATVTCSAGCNSGASTGTSLADGSYSIHVTFAGNSSQSIHLTASLTGYTAATSQSLSVPPDTTYDFALTPTDTTPPTVSSITRDGTSPTKASSVSWSVTFSESVTGVDSGDFVLASSGLNGASIISVTGGPLTYTVVASTGTGSGTLGLNLVDDDSIADTSGNKLGGTGAGNGSFTGTVYTIDRTPPTVTATPDRTADHNGWYNHSLTVTFSSTDADLASCDTPVTYTGPDSGTASVTGHCTDTTGNVGTATFSFQYDATAPSVTATPARSADHNGWFNSPVTITFSGTDATSGGVSCDAAVPYSAPDSAAASVNGGCTDAAGNTGHASYDFKYDGTAPTATIAVASGATAGTNGWYTSDLTLHTSGTDVVSGIESCTADQFETTETIGATFNGSCTNGAGLITSASPLSVKVDKTGPSAVLAITAGTLGNNGWYVSDVTLETTGQDSISGPVTCTDVQHQTTDTNGTTFNGSCTNDAGLSTNAAPVTVKVDTTAPTVTATADRSPDHNGWYNHALTVSFAATDSTSGVATCSPDVAYAGPDTAAASVSGTCTDQAGNVGTGTLTLEYDATAPTGVAATADRSPNGNGWYNSSVTFTFNGTDMVSGIASCSTVSYSGADNAAATVSGTCSDQAGNTSASANTTFKYDATPPTGVAVSPDRAADHNGWYNHAFTATWTGTDATSGIASCTTTPYSAPDTGSGSLNGSCTDLAGNTGANVPFAFKYDGTGPTAALAVTGGTAGANGWYTSDVTVTTSGTDAVSSPVTCTSAQTISTETAGTAVNGSCTNDAGLTTNATPLTVKLDKTGPTATLVASGTLGSNGWFTSDVSVHASGTDTISGPVTCTGDQFLTIDSVGTSFSGSCTNNAGLTTNATALTVKRDATQPTLTPVVSPSPVILNGTATASPGAADSTSGIASASCATPVTNVVGSQTASCTATDNAGNTNTATATYAVSYAPAGANCLGAPGLQVLQPIDPYGGSVFKQKSTVPVKFRACDANGVSVATPGIVSLFEMIGIAGANGAEVNEDIVSTTPDVTFRWSSTDQLWIFNLNTKNLTPGLTYWYRITLNDGSRIPFSFGLK